MQNKLKYRRDLKRPLTSGEVDDNFEFLAQAVSGAQFGIKNVILPNSPAPTESGQYPVKEIGVFANFKDSNGQSISVTEDDFKDGIVYIIYNGTYSYKFIAPIPLDGKVAEGDNRGVTGSEVFINMPVIKTRPENLINYFNENTTILSNGLPQSGSNRLGYVSIVNYPLIKGDLVEVSGDVEGNYISFIENDIVKNVDILGVDNYIKVIDYDCVMNCTIKKPGQNIDKASIVINSGTTFVETINNNSIGAKVLVEGNIVPSPTIGENAVNLNYLKDNSILKESIVLTKSRNLANKIIKDMAIHSSGELKESLGWVLLEIDISTIIKGESISFGNFHISNAGGYSAFYKEGNLVKYLGRHYSDNLVNKTVVKDIDCDTLYIDIGRPGQQDSDWDKVICNLGNYLIEWESPVGYISEIGGYRLKLEDSIQPKVNYKFPRQNLSYLANGLKPVINFIFDDLNDTDIDVFLEFKKYNFPVNFALIGSRIDEISFMKYKEIQEMGGSILSHTMDHPKINSSALEYDYVEDQIIKCKARILSLGGVCNGFVTPYSILNNDYKPIVHQSHSYAFTKNNTAFDRSTNVMDLSRFSIEGTNIEGNSLKQIKDKIDECVSQNLMVTFYAHKLPSSSKDANGISYLTIEKLRDILEYVHNYVLSGRLIVSSTDLAISMYYM